MPEGPEVRLYTELLNSSLSFIDSFEIRSGRYTRKRPDGWDKFSTPIGLHSVKCAGKFVYFHLTNGKYIWHTLGMTGCWTDYPVDDARIVINGHIYYSDTRNFGTFKFNMSRTETDAKLKTLGWDLLNENDDIHIVASFIRKKKQTLAQILMNQGLFAGVGNYVKAEALYRARLSPHREGKSLSEAEAVKLVQSAKDVLRESYASKPRAFVNYKECGKDFKKVVYKQSYDEFGNTVKAEETKDKRTTYWVPALQT